MIFFIAAALISLGLCFLVLKASVRFKALDVPNSRSSHLVAKPRTGGVGFILSILLGLIYLGYFEQLSYSSWFFKAFLGAATLGAIGFWDDFFVFDAYDV